MIHAARRRGVRDIEALEGQPFGAGPHEKSTKLQMEQFDIGDFNKARSRYLLFCSIIVFFGLFEPTIKNFKVFDQSINSFTGNSSFWIFISFVFLYYALIYLLRLTGIRKDEFDKLSKLSEKNFETLEEQGKRIFSFSDYGSDLTKYTAQIESASSQLEAAAEEIKHSYNDHRNDPDLMRLQRSYSFVSEKIEKEVTRIHEGSVNIQSISNGFKYSIDGIKIVYDSIEERKRSLKLTIGSEKVLYYCLEIFLPVGLFFYCSFFLVRKAIYV